MSVRDFIEEFVEEPTKNRKNGKVFIEDEAVFSYGRFYPVAVHRDGKFYVNSTSSSVTTNRHVSAAKKAIPVFEERTKAELIEMIGD